MLRALFVGVLVIVVALAALVWRAPASWLGERLAAASDNAVTLVAAEGTIWGGRGALASPDGRWRVPVAWHVTPAALVRGELDVAFDPVAGATRPTGNVRLGAGSLAVENLGLAIPAAAFERVLSPRVPLVLGGEILVDAPQATVTREATSGAFTLRWDRASIALAGTEPVALGTVNAALSARERGFAGPVSNSGGDVRVAGTLQWAERNAAVDITLTPLPSAPPSLVRLLSTFGTPAADGSVRLAWRGAVR